MVFESQKLSGVSIDRLTTLCQVVEAGTIALAAGPDLNRQSQFSRQLKDLEKALGTQLFDRAGKTMRANEMGRRVALAARTFFSALDGVIQVAAGQAEVIRLGAGESVLRWLVMPHLNELMSAEPPMRLEVQNFRTEFALRELMTGGIDLAILRSDSIGEDFEKEPIGNLRYVLAVPRNLLRTKEGAEVFEGRPLPFAELMGDGLFAKTVNTTAKAMGLNFRTVLQAQTFSLLISAVESGTAAAFVPDIAARPLPEERFAIVSADAMKALDRELSLVWKKQVADSRQSVRLAITRLRRTLGEKM